MLSIKVRGFLVIEVRAERSTAAAPVGPSTESGPVLFQNHGCPLRYRNVWVVDLGAGRSCTLPLVRGQVPGAGDRRWRLPRLIRSQRRRRVSLGAVAVGFGLNKRENGASKTVLTRRIQENEDFAGKFLTSWTKVAHIRAAATDSGFCAQSEASRI